VTGVLPEQVGALAHELGLMLYELSAVEPSLEESYMNLTADSIEYGADA
jgi:ABC-2 type transport system ATP-binding protein